MKNFGIIRLIKDNKVEEAISIDLSNVKQSEIKNHSDITVNESGAITIWWDLDYNKVKKDYKTTQHIKLSFLKNK